MITSLSNLNDAIERKDNAFFCCDCMDMMQMLPDKCIDIAIVDPIYGGVTKGGYMEGKGGRGAADQKPYNQSIWKQEKTSKEYFNELFRVSKNQVIWGANYFIESIAKDSQGWIVWDKKKHDGIKFADGELAWTSFNRALRIFRYKWDGMLQENMKDKEQRIHPTQKPVALYEWVLMNYASAGELILDTHVGSASSLIACERLGFNFIGCEKVDEYYTAALNRFKTETAQITLFNMRGN